MELFPVQIGQFTARGGSVPDKNINFGGAQRLGVHQLPGGVRIVDVMGPSDDDIHWKGTLYSDDVGDAVAAALEIDQMRQTGTPVTLSWDVLSYTVVIAHFKPEFEFVSRVPFEMVIKVIDDPQSPADQNGTGDLDTLVAGDMTNTLNSATQLNMTVPSAMPSPFSASFGSAQPANQAITWNG
ncbi:MAG TPA: hypothetical protein VFA12_20110 [Stellaceae bacterium]|nr:hypothetical protein [Stellaceae bacterium]